MSQQGSRKYGNLTLERGDLYAKRPAKAVAPVDPWLDREMQAVFANLHGEGGAIPSRPIYEAGEGYQWPWRRMGQRIREARAGRTPVEKVKQIVRVLDQYIDAQYRDDQPNRAA